MSQISLIKTPLNNKNTIISPPPISPSPPPHFCKIYIYWESTELDLTQADPYWVQVLNHREPSMETLHLGCTTLINGRTLALVTHRKSKSRMILYFVVIWWCYREASALLSLTTWRFTSFAASEMGWAVELTAFTLLESFSHSKTPLDLIFWYEVEGCSFVNNACVGLALS